MQPGDATLRSAIVNVAGYYLRMAKTKTPAEMEAIIWQHDSIDGADHGQSCAAFASMVLELGAQVVGQQSWVTGGGSYPWPLHEWVDARVNPNPGSMGITSIQQDAATHDRWHPLGDGYQPQPGDWVVFDGHVEVVTGYSSGVLQTIGGDSLPNFSVNAHEFNGPLAAQGVVGFVNNGALTPAAQVAATGTGSGGQAGGGTQAPATGSGQAPATTGAQTGDPGGGQAPSGAGPQAQAAAVQGPAAIPGASAPDAVQQAAAAAGGAAAIPGAPSAAPARDHSRRWLRRHPDPRPPRGAPPARSRPQPASALAGNSSLPGAVPEASVDESRAAGAAVIPGLPGAGHHHPVRSPARRRVAAAARAPRSSAQAPAAAAANASSAQQAFIEQIAPGAVATQQQIRCPGGRDHRAGHRRIRLGPERAWPPRTTTCSASRAPARPAATRSQHRSSRTASMVSQTASFRVVPQHRRKHRGSRQAAGDQRLLHACDGRAARSQRVRRGPDRDLRDRSRVRSEARHAHAAV